MKKNFIVFCFLLFSLNLFCEKFYFDDGYFVIEKVDGVDDLDNVKIVYDNGDNFFGSATVDGYPIYGVLVNQQKGITYVGAFDSNEQYTGRGILKGIGYKYEGDFKNGMKHGYGVLTDLNDNTIYEGNFAYDKKEGYGEKYSKINNYNYKGYWSNDRYNGEGLLSDDAGNSYKGNFLNGKQENYGTYIQTTGEITFGKWSNGKLADCDNCEYIGMDGTKYNGGIVSGLFEGDGVYSCKDKAKYTGSFSKNQRTGFGQQIYEDGSEYTGYYLGNVRNYAGSFKFSNGLVYEGGFLNGQFYQTGYLYAEVDNEQIVLASDVWDSAELPISYMHSKERELASIFPKKGIILFGNGDMYEGYFDNGRPILGMGIWSTLDERTAKQENANFNYVSYKIDDKTFDLSSVFSETEVYKKINSKEYVGLFNDFYKKHKPIFDKVFNGLQFVAGVLSILPSPIQPIAATAEILISSIHIAVKTTSKAIDIYDACVAGNKNLIPSMLSDYGKDITWDVINIVLGMEVTQQFISKITSKISSNVAKGFKTAGNKIGVIMKNTISKHPRFKPIIRHLDELLKMGKGITNNVSNVVVNSGFYKFVQKNGGKSTNYVKNQWIKTVYPKLFAEYGDDATRLIFKHGDVMAKQLSRNGDVIVKAIISQGDDVARLFLKNGDEIADLVRNIQNYSDDVFDILYNSGAYADGVIKYLSKSNNLDEALKLAKRNKTLGNVVHKYGDTAIETIQRYRDNAVLIFSKNGDEFAKALKANPAKHNTLYRLFSEYSDDAGKLYKKHGNRFVELFEKTKKELQFKFISAVKKGGKETLDIMNKIPKSEYTRTLDFLDIFDTKTYTKYSKNGILGKEITEQVISNSRDTQILRDTIAGKLKNVDGKTINYVNNADRYVGSFTQELKPNIVYRTGEGNYYYMTDNFGRIKKVEASNLRLKEDILNEDFYMRNPLGHNKNSLDKLASDDAGHLIASRFGGSDELDNIISMDSKLNQSGEWRKMERNLKKSIQKGQRVSLEIEVIYKGSSKRPYGFKVNPYVNGKLLKGYDDIIYNGVQEALEPAA